MAARERVALARGRGPQAGDDLDTLIRHADIAMYRMKNSGKDGYQVFSEEMNSGLTQRHSLEQDLRRAGLAGDKLGLLPEGKGWLFVEFGGAHEVPMSVLQELSGFLRGCLTGG